MESSPHRHPGGHCERHDHPRVGHAEHEVSDGVTPRTHPSPSAWGQFRVRGTWGTWLVYLGLVFPQEGMHLVLFLCPGLSPRPRGKGTAFLTGLFTVPCGCPLSECWPFVVKIRSGFRNTSPRRGGPPNARSLGLASTGGQVQPHVKFVDLPVTVSGPLRSAPLGEARFVL